VLALLFSRVVSRARRGLAVALVCAALLAGCGGPHARFESHVQRGKQYFDHGEFQKARIEFLNALRIEPKNGDATLLVGRANEKLGDIRAAIGSYQAAVDMHPDDPAPRAALGRLMLMSGAADQAAAMVAPGLKAHPLDPDLLVVRAGVRMQQSDLSDARVDAEAAVKAAPQNEDALALLASLYRRVDGPQKAIDFLEGETAQLPKAEGLRLILASLYMETGADEKAEPVLVKLTELKPEDEGLRNQLAHFYVRSKRLDDAERVLDEAVKAFPKSNEAKLELVTFLAAERSHEAAERRLGGFIGKKPDDLDLRMMLGDLRYQFAEPDGAIEAYRAIIAKDPHGPQGLKAKDHIAGIEFQRGHADVGEKLVREVLASNARDSDALLMRVNLELDRNDPAAAIVDLRGLLRDQPNSMPLELLLARAQLANGETGLAEATLRGALQAAPGSLDASISLSRFLIDTGRAAEGQSVAEGALQRDPNSPAALAMVARAEIINGRWTEAQQTAEKLESLDRKSALGPYLIARAALGRRDFEVAGRALERALALDPVSVDVLAAYAKFDNARGHGGAAIARVRKTLEAHPDDARVGNLLGMLYAGSKDLPQAIEALNATIARAPDWVEPRRNLAVVKLAANDMNGAIAAYEGALKLAPTDAQTVASLADLYVREGRVEDAIARYEALYKANVRVRAFAANNLAMLLVNYHKDPESLKRARELTETFSTSDDAAYLDTSGWVRLKGGEVREALPLLERAVARAPDSRVIRYHVALAELEVGDRGKAKTNLETALAGSARFEGVEDARSVLARLKNSAG
jgi:tetratricopeptide (TPR) repeat protein